MAPAPRLVPLAPPAGLATFGRLRAMLSASGVAAGLFCVAFAMGFYNEVNLKGIDGASGALLLAFGALTMLMLAKAACEIGAVMRLRGVPNVPLSALPGLDALAKVARVWLVGFWALFIGAAAHLVYVVLEMLVFLLGLVVALIVTIGTVGGSARSAFSTWWDVVVAMARVWDYEAKLWSAVFSTEASVVVAWIAVALLFGGPTLIALWIHARRALFAPAAQPPMQAPMAR